MRERQPATGGSTDVLEKMARPERFERPTLRFVGSSLALLLHAFRANRAFCGPLILLDIHR